eukprot:TRINITY_DN10594_c0_g1_i1.p1 TRINITY_DN10594_c0_g1~~TRINITY_DN10594_c0_g1_i1.p1  ORF type:complete len:285 (-),score=118.10 TRINITY_DN10594_c0_g1_i1:56-910(-)
MKAVTMNRMMTRVPQLMMQIRKCSNLVNTHLENNGQIAVITLNNPSKLNALTEPMGDALIAKVEEVKKMEDVRAAIVTGAGKAFSAGGDLDWLLARHRDTPESNIRIMQEFYQKFLVLRSLPMPVIAAINGPAVGAGLCLAMGGADIRVASNTARMGVTFTKLGLHPGMAATHFLPNIVGPQIAADLLLTGRLVKAEEALSLGLVARVGDCAVTVAMDLAKDICLSGPISVRTLVQTLRDKQNVGLQEAYRVEATAQSICYPTKDLAEGVKALQEKRSPVFENK